MIELNQYIMEKTGLNLSQKKLNELSKVYEPRDAFGDKLFKLAKSFVNTETSFFRNIEVSELLKDLIGTKNKRIWFAGCSTGQEVYSALLMSGNKLNLELIGTDINYDAIYHAKKGKYLLYRMKEIEKVNLFKEEYFINIFPSESLKSTYVEFSPTIRKNLHFDIHNLISGPYSLEFDIVICRNVLLHMTENGKSRVLDTLALSVKKGGFLLLGDTDPKMVGSSWKRINEGNLIIWQKT